MQPVQTDRDLEFVAVHLVHRVTGRYFIPPDQWVEEPGRATRFRSSTEAIRTAYEAGLKDLELLLAFALPAYHEVRIPLRRA